jgi:hypothetical protein
MRGYSWTKGMQGGIGYPPLVVNWKSRWWSVKDSESHGGSKCAACAKAGVERCPRLGVTDEFMGQARARQWLGDMPQMSWADFARRVSEREERKPRYTQTAAEALTRAAERNDDLIDAVTALCDRMEELTLADDPRIGHEFDAVRRALSAVAS